MRTTLVALLLCGLLGCGGDGTGGGGPLGGGGGSQPATHSIDEGGGLREAAAASYTAIGPFSVPAGATVSYSLTDMPVGFGDDAMQAAIVPASMIGSANPAGYGIATLTGSGGQTTEALPGGSYELYVVCANVIDECAFDDVVTAYY